jgi:hypothetical protein
VAVAEQGQGGAAALVDGELRNEDLDGVGVLFVLDIAVSSQGVKQFNEDITRMLTRGQ